MDSVTIKASSTAYCGIAGHVRVWAGGESAKPRTCSCGAVRYVRHLCECGNIHETQISNDPVTAVLRRDWDTLEENEAWKDL